MCLAIEVIGNLLLTTGLSWLMGAKIQAQVAELSDTLPATIENVKSRLSQNPIGKKLVEIASDPEAMKKAKALDSTFFKTTFGFLVIFTCLRGPFSRHILSQLPSTRCVGWTIAKTNH